MPRNTSLFVAFRVCFNARFYYPVLAVLFVDLGLTVEQYALLNVAWALSIVLCELPLGALGDQVGRRPPVVAAAALMLVERAVLAFAPTGDPTLLFWVFLVNRVLSGVAEAAASGADEALAYDSLADAGRREDWPRVLSSLARWQGGAMAAAMVLGGLVYDPVLMRDVAGWLGLDADVDQRTTARFPVYLTLALSLGALATALRMEEPPHGKEEPSLGENLRRIGQAGAWIARTRFALGLVLFGLLLDTSIRIFLTLNSAYFRLIGIPAAFFGFLGAGFSACAVLVPPLAERLVARATPLANYAVVSALALLGLGGAAATERWWGVFAMVPLALGWSLLSYFGSHYLNAATESRRRATVLSFRSLANNLAYGAAGWAFALLMASLAGGARPDPGSPEEAAVFSRALVWIPIGLAVLLAPLLLWARRGPAMRGGEVRP